MDTLLLQPESDADTVYLHMLGIHILSLVPSDQWSGIYIKLNFEALQTAYM